MRLLDKATIIVDFSIGIRVLNQRPKSLLIKLKRLMIPDDYFDPKRPGSCPDHIDRLRVAFR